MNSSNTFFARDGDVDQGDVTNDASARCWETMHCFHFSLTDDPGMDHFALSSDPGMLGRLLVDLAPPAVALRA